MSSQWSQGVVPPPAGVEPNFINPENQMAGNIVIHTIFLTLSTLSVIMRIYTRLYVSRVTLGVDDYLCLLAYAATATYSGLLLTCFHWGIGRHIWDEPAIWLIPALKFQTIAAQIYFVATTVIKLSLLFLYRRIFNLQKTAKWFVNGGIVLVTLMGVSILLAIIFFCFPVEKAWNNSIPGHCSSPAPVSYLSGAWNAFVDIYVLILPIPLLWGLNMGPKRKIRLGAVFGIGIFGCAASLVRLGMTPLLQSDLDSTYNIAKVSVWATLEINVGLICSCLMLLPAFLRHHLPESAKSYFRSITFSKGSGSAKASTGPSQKWGGVYQHKVSSDSQNLVTFGEENKILRTNTFTMETVRAPPDLERGNPNITRF
ncbi:uncharacterized protein GGS22DRAFT_101847 [Annulohypoxylon maeteangense]|uniref:uncharacterized protein n=1 Tax=Annulohypoxylon maeteangense TaxID=1927788 RepID=UPI002007BAE3|nr:uncharacterized protein GGS22DRAFT_101847 [Annulohypoxylon maeteangense]KAI0879953.1 hypothetical protein GGS22DRAFT_101847 [Annulohypoxylon maeteangense]